MKKWFLLLITASLLQPAARAQRAIPPAFGPHVNLSEKEFTDSTSFDPEDRIVGTYYFYWYDEVTGSHIVDHDGTDALTTHPPTIKGLSWKSVAWHRKQLEDMMAAGIDAVLPVFWGAPSEQSREAHLHWSYGGIPPLVAAREELLREGRKPPHIGLFYDTSTLRHNAWGEHQDLTTERGHQWFYATIRDFYSMVPPRHWAMINGRPIVLLYSATFAKRHDQGVVDYLHREFPKEFGGRIPWLAREVSWNVQADDTVSWGGALGLKNPGVASLGPGYDHSAVPGRTPLVAERRGGQFYEEQWLKFLRRPSKFVMLETWNEWHEGTDIAESREYGRQYIELTRKYVDLFKQGWQPPWPKGPYSKAESVSITLGKQNQEKGMVQVENEDGVTTADTIQGRTARSLQPGKSPGRYLYLKVADSFKNPTPADLTLEVNFLDSAPGSLGIDYDGSDQRAPFAGAYTPSPDVVKLTGNGQWRTATFRLPAARLLNGQNRNADLRLVVQAATFHVSKVSIRRPKTRKDN